MNQLRTAPGPAPNRPPRQPSCPSWCTGIHVEGYGDGEPHQSAPAVIPITADDMPVALHATLCADERGGYVQLTESQWGWLRRLTLAEFEQLAHAGLALVATARNGVAA